MKFRLIVLFFENPVNYENFCEVLAELGNAHVYHIFIFFMRIQHILNDIFQDIILAIIFFKNIFEDINILKLRLSI